MKDYPASLRSKAGINSAPEREEPKETRSVDSFDAPETRRVERRGEKQAVERKKKAGGEQWRSVRVIHQLVLFHGLQV